MALRPTPTTSKSGTAYRILNARQVRHDVERLWWDEEGDSIGGKGKLSACGRVCQAGEVTVKSRPNRTGSHPAPPSKTHPKRPASTGIDALSDMW